MIEMNADMAELREQATLLEIKNANLKEKLEVKTNENNFLSQQVERQLQLISGDDQDAQALLLNLKKGKHQKNKISDASRPGSQND